jgi:hypothetical protein
MQESEEMLADMPISPRRRMPVIAAESPSDSRLKRRRR